MGFPLCNQSHVLESFLVSFAQQPPTPPPPDPSLSVCMNLVGANFLSRRFSLVCRRPGPQETVCGGVGGGVGFEDKSCRTSSNTNVDTEFLGCYPHPSFGFLSCFCCFDDAFLSPLLVPIPRPIPS